VARTEDPFQRRRLLAGDESGGLQRGKGVERLAGLPSSRDPEREGGGGRRRRRRRKRRGRDGRVGGCLNIGGALTPFAMLLKLSSSSFLRLTHTLRESRYWPPLAMPSLSSWQSSAGTVQAPVVLFNGGGRQGPPRLHCICIQDLLCSSCCYCCCYADGMGQFPPFGRARRREFSRLSR
jgi:hypothetical protein